MSSSVQRFVRAGHIFIKTLFPHPLGDQIAGKPGARGLPHGTALASVQEQINKNAFEKRGREIFFANSFSQAKCYAEMRGSSTKSDPVVLLISSQTVPSHNRKAEMYFPPAADVSIHAAFLLNPKCKTPFAERMAEGVRAAIQEMKAVKAESLQRPDNTIKDD
jgi:hypothetical protein